MMMILLAGCMVCRGELTLIDADGPLAAGESTTIEMLWQGETVDPCSVRWFVDEIEGGDEIVGTITGCGTYTAPDSPPGSDPMVIGADSLPGTCMDCCLAASIEIALAR